MDNKKIFSLAFSIGMLIAANQLRAMETIKVTIPSTQVTIPCVQPLITQMGLQAPVTLEEIHIPDDAPITPEDGAIYDLISLLSSAETTPTSHRIRLTPTIVHHLNTPSDACHHLALAIMYHELGHAKQMESDAHHLAQLRDCFEQICKKHFDDATMAAWYQLLYAEELYADAVIPEEKLLLVAIRDFFRDKHIALIHGKDEVLGPIPDGLKAFGQIDFNVPLNEELARTWDIWHKDCCDVHPSHYRRAYMFNERLKALEAQEEREQGTSHARRTGIATSDYV